MPHPPSPWRREVGHVKVFLRTTTKEGIAITNLTKKTPPILSTTEDGWGN
jgi:hypothetical protein